MWVGGRSHGVAVETETVAPLTPPAGRRADHGLVLLREEHVHVRAGGGGVVVLRGRPAAGVDGGHLLVHKDVQEGLPQINPGLFVQVLVAVFSLQCRFFLGAHHIPDLS